MESKWAVTCLDVSWVSATRQNGDRTAAARSQAKKFLMDDFKNLFTFFDIWNGGILITFFT